MRTRLSLVLGLVCLMVMPVLAHHSFDAEYDSTKTMTIVGYVTKVDWVNPHAFVYLDSKDDKGAVHSYRIEMGPPYALQRERMEERHAEDRRQDHRRECGSCQGWQQHRGISSLQPR